MGGCVRAGGRIRMTAQRRTAWFIYPTRTTGLHQKCDRTHCAPSHLVQAYSWCSVSLTTISRYRRQRDQDHHHDQEHRLPSLPLQSLSQHGKEMLQAPNCSNQGDEEMKLSTHETRDTRETPSKQATSNKKQQEPIDEGTKNSTSLPQPTTPSLTRASS